MLSLNNLTIINFGSYRSPCCHIFFHIILVILLTELLINQPVWNLNFLREWENPAWFSLMHKFRKRCLKGKKQVDLRILAGRSFLIYFHARQIEKDPIFLSLIFYTPSNFHLHLVLVTSIIKSSIFFWGFKSRKPQYFCPLLSWIGSV